jgi:hypothetical protein
MARLAGRSAETLDRLWHAGLNNRFSLFGGAALFAYESQSATLAPAALVKDEHLQFVAQSLEDLPLEEMAKVCDLDEGGTSTVEEDHRILIHGRDRVLCEIIEPRFFLQYLERGPAETLREAFELPSIRGLTVSRDCRPIELTALDPRTYAMAATCLREQDIWADRADFSAAMVRECWPEKFDDDQFAVLDEEPDAGWHRTRGPY